MMKRVISSFLTLYLRIILPGVSLIGGVIVPIVVYVRSKDPNPLDLSIGIFVLFFVFAGVISLVSYQYKRVAISGDNLLVSNYGKEESISLTEVQNVTERRLRGHPVTIHLRTPSKFGQKITFLAKSRSIVAELKEMAGLENVKSKRLSS